MHSSAVNQDDEQEIGSEKKTSRVRQKSVDKLAFSTESGLYGPWVAGVTKTEWHNQRKLKMAAVKP